MKLGKYSGAKVGNIDSTIYHNGVATKFDSI